MADGGGTPRGGGGAGMGPGRGRAGVETIGRITGGGGGGERGGGGGGEGGGGGGGGGREREVERWRVEGVSSCWSNAHFANRTGRPLAVPAARVSGAYSRGSRSASSCLHPGRPCYSYQVPLPLLLRNDTLWHSLPGDREIDDKGQIDSTCKM